MLRRSLSNKIEQIFKRIQKDLNLSFISDAFPFKTVTRFPQPVQRLGGRRANKRGLTPSTLKRLYFVVNHFFNTIEIHIIYSTRKFITIYLRHVSVFVTTSSERPLRYLLKKCTVCITLRKPYSFEQLTKMSP